MPFWNDASAALEFSADVRLTARMPREKVLEIYRRLTGRDDAEGDVLCLPICQVPGGALAPVCFLRADCLHAVLCTVSHVGQRRGDADARRALLFELLRAEDPSRDSRQSVLLRCAGGSALIATDPHTGDAMLRVTYR